MTLQQRSTMRLRILHTTTYRYEPQATSVIQILRMTPGSHDGQYVAEWQIDVSTHTKITAEGLIETHDTGGVLRGADERFPAGMFLRATDLTTVNPAMNAVARQ